jgi:hypothetical protein
MKYIVFRRTWHSFIQECPVIFPSELNHEEVFHALKDVDGMEDAALVSAGFLDLLHAPHCFGNSDTLHATSRGSVDANMIKDYINNRGIID